MSGYNSEITMHGDYNILYYSFKCEKEVGEIKFDRSNLKGVDKKALSGLKKVARFSFSDNNIEKLSPGALCVDKAFLISEGLTN